MAEGNYDPLSATDPQERAAAEQMRDAIEQGDWSGAQRLATTPALRRWYAQAKAELGGPALAPAASATPVAHGPLVEPRIDLLGDPVASPVGRLVHIDAGTRHVTVEGGETIRFDSNGRQFSWSFSGPLSVTAFNLRRVAPPGMLERDLMVYIRPNPNYIGPS